MADAVEVFFALPFERAYSSLGACWQVAEQDLPGDAADFFGDAGPGGVAEVGEGNGACLEKAFEFVDAADAGGVSFYFFD